MESYKLSFSLNEQVAIQQPEFKKIEAENHSGIMRISQRIELMEVKLVLGFYTRTGHYVPPGATAILRGDAGTMPWAKQLFKQSAGESFVLCPESQILGFVNV